VAKQIRIEHVFKVFGGDPKRALDLVKQGLSKSQILEQSGQSIGVFDAHFSIEAGETFVVMGLSGSGKSTLVRMLNRLIEPTSGQILVDGQDIGALNAKALRELRRKDISMVFQSFALMPHMNVLDNTAFGLELDGVDKATRHQQAQAALEQVGLAAWGASYPDELSGGMQQRVGLARALASNPSILLMDEAFSALDPIIRSEMQSELLRLQKIQRRTIVFISHDLDEATRIGDRIAIMKDGQVVQVGTPDEILRSPANDYVKSFIRGVDAALVFKAGDLARKKRMTFISEQGEHCGCHAVLHLLEEADRDYAYIQSADGRFLGVVTPDSLRQALKGQTHIVGVKQAFLNVPPVPANKPVTELFEPVVAAPCPLPVIGDKGEFIGAISRNRLLRFLDRETPPLPAQPKQVEPIVLDESTAL